MLTPCIMDENTAAKNDGTKKWKITLFESITPLAFQARLNLNDPRVHKKPIEKPIAVAAPGL